MTRLVQQSTVSYTATVVAVMLLVYIAAAQIPVLTTDAIIATLLALSGPLLSKFGGFYRNDSEPAEQAIGNALPWAVFDLAVIFSLGYFIPRTPLDIQSVVQGNLNVRLAFNVLEAVAEEQFFRAFLLNFLLSRVDPYTSVVADGLFFGIYHFFVYGYSANLILLVMFSGMALAYSDWRQGTLAPSLIAHVVNNLLV